MNSMLIRCSCPGSAGIDQELDVDALYVHIAEASVAIPVVGVYLRILRAHEPAGGTTCRGPWRRLAEHAWHIGSPTADGPAAAEAKARRVRWIIFQACRVPLLGHFTALQVGYKLAYTGREVLVEGIGRWPICVSLS
jgi:hypothetical protein